MENTSQMSQEYLVMPESKEVLKNKQTKNNNDDSYQKNTGTNLKKLLMAKDGII